MILGHRCPCGHVDAEHVGGGGQCSFGWCKCTRSRDSLQAEPVEVIPTYQLGTLAEVERIAEPGSAIFGSFYARSRTCACPACQDRWADLTVAALSGAATAGQQEEIA